MKWVASSAPVMNHLRPVIFQRSLPAGSALVSIMPGSEPAPGDGSVITKAERTVPSTIGFSQRCFWSGVATRLRTNMLPSSGAAQLKQTGPKIERFISS
jgi:hypothetical protein